jgi:hypothetical protein
MAQKPVRFVVPAGDQPTGQSGAGEIVINLRIRVCVECWVVGHEYGHNDSATVQKQKQIDLPKKQVEAVHGPCYALVCDLFSPDLAAELGVLGRSFKIHR